MDGINVVGFVCIGERKILRFSKIKAILLWELYLNIIKARAFIRVCVYFWIFVLHFALVAKLIYMLFKKGVKFQ